MKCVFLDPVRCLTNVGFLRKNVHLASFDPKNISALNELIGLTYAKIVLTSETRFDMPMLQTRRWYADHKVFGDILDRTPELSGQPRWQEIQTWLDMSSEPVESFVILDDEDDMGPLQKHLIRTKFSTGFSLEDVPAAVSLLMGGA